MTHRLSRVGIIARRFRARCRNRLGLLFLLLLAGCSRSEESSTQRPRYPEAQPVVTATFHQVEAPPAQFQGLAATQWAERLDAPDFSVREEAAQALGTLKQAGLPHLMAGMRSRSWEVRLAALQAVHKPVLVEQAAEAMPLLTELLRDANPLVRQQAAYRLSWLGDQARGALPMLEQLAARDDSPDVRATAADVVVEMNESLAELAKLLGDRNPLVRERAIQTLAGLQQYARSALPTLEYLAASDADPGVRQAAAEAAASIQQALANEQ